MASIIRPEIIDWTIQLYYAEKRLDVLQSTLTRLDDLAQKQVGIAENLLTTECTLIDLATSAAGQATSAVRTQQYACAAERANVNALAQIGRETQRAMRGFDGYQCGARRATIRGAHVAMARGAGSAKANAMRNEDAMFDDSLQWRFANIASATGGFNYSANGFAGLNRFYQNLAGDLVGDINRYVGEAVAGIGAFFGERSVDNVLNQKVDVQLGDLPATRTLEENQVQAQPAENTVVERETVRNDQQIVVLSNDNDSNSDSTPAVDSNSTSNISGG